MRLRRLEFIIISITLAFICFMGGFFTGRSWSVVNVVAAVSETENNAGTTVNIASVQTPQDEMQSQSGMQNPVTDDTQKTPDIPDKNAPPEAPPEAPSEATGAPKQGDGKININIATQSELKDLPGIGDVLASRIVDYRRQNGDFSRIEDIKNVSGIGEKRYQAIEDKITVG